MFEQGLRSLFYQIFFKNAFELLVEHQAVCLMFTVRANVVSDDSLDVGMTELMDYSTGA